MKRPVVIIKTPDPHYPDTLTFRPSIRYPEYCFEEISPEDNPVYDMVRNGLFLMGYDRTHYETSEWNPLSGMIVPGNTVLIKPNMVMHQNLIRENGTDCLVTHPSLVAAMVDYCILALKGSGRIIIGDAPMQECHIEELWEQRGYNRLLAYYRSKLEGSGISIELQDFRGLRSLRINGVNHSSEVPVSGTVIDLGQESEFYGETRHDRMRITNYDPALLKSHHDLRKNEYFINNAVLQADVIINMPKPKTHRKAGVTISLKNLVGINCRKEYLPHHTNGSLHEGGDEYLYPSGLKRALDALCDRRNYYSQTKKAYKTTWILNKFYRILNILIHRFAKDQYYEGSWFGNDTISRTIVDLNKILYYADKNGVIQSTRQRKQLIVADMIISGEKEGPVAPTPKEVGIIALGECPVCFDEAVASLMGAAIDRIHTLKHARSPKGSLELAASEDQALLLSNDEKLNGLAVSDIGDVERLHFIPTTGWTEAFFP